MTSNITYEESMEENTVVRASVPASGGVNEGWPVFFRPVVFVTRRNPDNISRPAPVVQLSQLGNTNNPEKKTLVPIAPSNEELERNVIDLPLVDCSVAGTFSRIGEFRLGSMINKGQKSAGCIEEYLARKVNTDEFFVIKILKRKPMGVNDTLDDIKGKIFFHTENTLLPLLENEPGIIHHHGVYRFVVEKEHDDKLGATTHHKNTYLAMILDCFVGHDYGGKGGKCSNITNLCKLVISKTKLAESQAIRIFCKVLEIVKNVHELNIIHRDLKLNNIIYNKVTEEVKLHGFCLGKQISDENDLLTDQRGSPGYMSPEIVGGRAYAGYPSDMWSLGICLFCLLYGKFPFYDNTPQLLFQKIKTGKFDIPVDVKVSQKTINVLSGLLTLNPEKRLTASQALKEVKEIIMDELNLTSDTNLQVVPDSVLSEFEKPSRQIVKRKYTMHKDIDKILGWDKAKMFLETNVRDIMLEMSLEKNSEQCLKKPKMAVGSPDFCNTIGQLLLSDKDFLRFFVDYMIKLKEQQQKL